MRRIVAILLSLTLLIVCVSCGQSASSGQTSPQSDIPVFTEPGSEPEPSPETPALSEPEAPAEPAPEAPDVPEAEAFAGPEEGAPETDAAVKIELERAEEDDAEPESEQRETEPQSESEVEATDFVLAARAKNGTLLVDITDIEADDYAEDGTILVTRQHPQFTVTIADDPETAQAIEDDLNGLISDFTAESVDEVDLTYNITEFAQEGYQQAQEYGYDWYPYANEFSAAVVRADSRVLSLCVNFYYNAGGPHGYYGSFGYSYDVATGQRLTLENLSADGADFAAAAKEMILEQCRDGGFEDELYPDYADYLDEVVQDGNFFFTDYSIVFIAQPYVIAPYAAGQFTFDLTYGDLSGIVRDDYLK